MNQEEIDKAFREITKKIKIRRRVDWGIVALAIGGALFIVAMMWLLTLTSLVTKD